MSRIRVAVLFGGRSGEHEVSCVSARHVVAAMDPQRYEVVPIGIGRDGRWMLPDASRKVLEGGPLEVPVESFKAEGEQILVSQDPSRREMFRASSGQPLAAFDVAFPVLHGPFGEDGTVQGLLEMAGIPYVGSGVLGSAVSMDKQVMKTMFIAAGLPIPRFVVVRDHLWAADPSPILAEIAMLGPVVFTKPANLGSSVGINRCTSESEIKAGIEEAMSHDRKVLVEEAIDGRELECGVLGNEALEASVVGEIVAGRDFYDYVAKYHDESSRTVIPADVPSAVSELVQTYAIKAFASVEASGMARVDFFYQAGGRGVIVNEINTIPGFTTISMYPKLWEASGVSYAGLIDRLIALAIERHERRPRSEELAPPS